MKIYVKNKIVSMGGSSVVTNEQGEEIFVVKGKVFTFTRKKIIKSMDGEVLYKVKNRFFNFVNHRAYIQNADGSSEAKITRKGLKLNQEYVIEGYDDDLAVNGDFISWTLNISRNGEFLGTIKRRFDLTDSFELDVPDEADAAFLVALVIAIDNIVDNITR